MANGSFINNEQLETSIKKIRMYKNTINLDLEEIEKHLKNILLAFDTKNESQFEEINGEFINKDRVVNQINNDYVYVLEKTMENYNQLAKKVANDFKNML